MHAYIISLVDHLHQELMSAAKFMCSCLHCADMSNMHFSLCILHFELIHGLCTAYGTLDGNGGRSIKSINEELS